MRRLRSRRLDVPFAAGAAAPAGAPWILPRGGALGCLVAGVAAGLAIALVAGAARAAPTPLTTELVASGLVDPLFVTFAPGDADRVFIVEQPGVIRILDVASEPPVLLGSPFLDIQGPVVDGGDEQGLLGLAFHPDFQSNGFFYVNYTGSGGDTRVSRFEVPVATPNDANEASELVLLTIDQPQSNHNGGWMAFGPNDGLLYIAIGDGGGGGDDDAGHTPGVGNGQDITANLLGKILRIDVDGNDGPGGTYGIPPQNPFVNETGDDEIWAYGLRNPWRNAFDRLTGDLYIADVGQATWEEVDFQPAASAGGENWGWRCREGPDDFNFGGDCGSATLLDPIYEYSHGGSPFRCSITGGEVYRGCAVPDLSGTYFYADYCSDQIWSFQVQGGAVTNLQERTAELDPPGALSITNITSFGLDAEGEIYIVDRGGEVFKIVPDGPAAACPSPVPATSRGGLVALALALLALTLFGIPRSLRTLTGAVGR
jgi:glucose/arabinose dehydrogenase